MTNITNLPAVNVAPLPARHRPRGMNLDGMQDCLQFSKVAVASGILSPAFMKAPDPVAAAFVAIQLGAEVGLSPMASLQNIAVINGKPGLYGPAMLAVVEASGLLADIDEGVTGEGMERHGWCTVQRVGRKPRTFKFSMEDAKKARLTGKQGPWTEYPDRMLLARARTFALRDIFPDVLAGLPQSVEELRDAPAEPRDITPIAAPDAVIPSSQQPNPSLKPPLEVVIGDGWAPAKFPRGKKGLREALEFMTGAVVDGKPQVVGFNNQLLDDIAEHIPELADEVSELRAAAVEALKPKDEDEDQDMFVQRFVNGDDPDPDDFPGPSKYAEPLPGS